MRWDEMYSPLVVSVSKAIILEGKQIFVEAKMSAVNVDKVLQQLTVQLMRELDKDSSSSTPDGIAKILSRYKFTAPVIQKVLTNSGVDPTVAANAVASLEPPEPTSEPPKPAAPAEPPRSTGPNYAAVPYPKPKTAAPNASDAPTIEIPKTQPPSPAGPTPTEKPPASKTNGSAKKAQPTGPATPSQPTTPAISAKDMSAFFKVDDLDPDFERIMRSTQSSVNDLLSKGKTKHAVDVLNSRIGLLTKMYKKKFIPPKATP